jgi:hypothetical protein
MSPCLLVGAFKRGHFSCSFHTDKIYKTYVKRLYSKSPYTTWMKTENLNSNLTLLEACLQCDGWPLQNVQWMPFYSVKVSFITILNKLPLTAGFSWYFPSAVSSWAELNNCHLSTNSLTPTQLQLTAITQLTPLRNLSTDPTENTISNSSSVVGMAWCDVFHCCVTACLASDHVGNTARSSVFYVVWRRKHCFLQLLHCCMTSLLPWRRLPGYCVAMDNSFCLTCYNIMMSCILSDHSHKLKQGFGGSLIPVSNRHTGHLLIQMGMWIVR